MSVPAHYSDQAARLGERVEAAVAAAPPVTSDHEGAPDAVADAAEAEGERLAGELVRLSHDLHAHPEPAYEEHHAVAAIAGLLADRGHEPETGAFGLATALRCRAGTGRPRVAILAEYDALPGIGHACGHNVIAAAAVGAFLSASAVDFEGSVELIGTPAEEGGGGKEKIARAGGFDDVDAAVMCHPWMYDVAWHEFIGRRQVAVTYHGRAAHAAAMPYMGANALDATVQAYTGIAALRQHILPADRVHGIITDGGQRPNVVPERGAALFYLRSAEPETLRILSDRARQVFEAAATATGTRAEIEWDPRPVYLPVRHNHALAARFAVHAGRRGRKMAPGGVVPSELTGSTDLGNVSVRVPAIHPMVAIAPPSASIHHPDFAGWAASDGADRGLLDGAVGLGLTALDYLFDAGLRADVRSEFDAAGGILDPADLFA